MQTMDQGARLWLYKTARRNYWRIAAWYEFDDLIQDGCVCYANVVKKYQTDRNRVRRRQHIMHLFKVSFVNHMHDLAKRRTKCAAEVKILDVKSSYQNEFNAWGDLQTDADDGDLFDFERLIAEAPSAIQPLLDKLIHGDCARTLRAAYRVRSTGARETINERLCRLVGVDPGSHDLATALRSYLAH